MTAGSLFSGGGLGDAGLSRAGIRHLWFCDIDANCRSVLRRHWPDVPVHEEVRALKGSDLVRPDLLIGGFPCTDLSIAGRRAGLAGERSGLFYEFARLIGEIAPEWVVLENVPGLLSSDQGTDMAAVVGTLGELGYGWAYRICDARWWGVAQRRRRVFIVCRSGGRAASCAQILSLPESLQGHPSPSRTQRQDVAGSLGSGSPGRGWSDDTDRMTFVPRVLKNTGHGWWNESDTAQAIRTPAGGGSMEANLVGTVARCVTSREGCRNDAETQTLIACGIDGSDLGYSLRARPSHSGDKGDGGVNTTLIATFVPHHNEHEGRGASFQQADRTPSLRGPNGTDNTLIAFQERGRAGGRNVETQEDLAYALCNPGEGGRGQERNIAQGMTVRRLTPRECERLMGVEDDFTAWGVDEDGRRVEMSDSARYRMAGNGIVANCSEWIGRRLLAAARETGGRP